MINRVNDNDYYDYRKLKMPTAADTTSNGEKFSLDYQRTDDKKEEDGKQEKIAKEGMDNNLAGNRSRTVVQSGVKLELSGTGRGKDPVAKEETFAALFATVRTWVSAFLQSCKGLLDRIWNDPATEEEVLSAQEVPVDETERLSEEYLEMNPLEPVAAASEEPPAERNYPPLLDSVTRDKEIQKYLRSGNLEQVISLLTEDGRRTMARNSSLLTYYDRTGRLTSMSASDQERILHGDRNVRKL